MTEETYNQDLLELVREQKEELDNILYSISDAVWSRRADNFELVYVNNAYYKLFGYTEEDLKQDRNMSLECIHPDDRDEFLEATRSVKTNGAVEFTYRFIHKDSRIKTLRVQGRLKKGINGKPDMINGITVDITRETEFNQAIRNSEQRLLATINNTRDLIWSVDTNLQILFCNESFRQFFYKLAGVRMKEGDYVLGEWRSASFISKRKVDYERTLNGESFITMVEENYNGNTLYFEISSSPIRDHDGNIIGVNCISRDITEQEKQLIQITQQNERLKEIAWIQSHKVRGPVASILGLVSLFDLEAPCNHESNAEVLDKLKIATNDLDAIIREVVQSTIYGGMN